jgi:hypothetical protein
VGGGVGVSFRCVGFLCLPEYDCIACVLGVMLVYCDLALDSITLCMSQWLAKDQEPRLSSCASISTRAGLFALGQPHSRLCLPEHCVTKTRRVVTIARYMNWVDAIPTTTLSTYILSRSVAHPHQLLTHSTGATMSFLGLHPVTTSRLAGVIGFTRVLRFLLFPTHASPSQDNPSPTQPHLTHTSSYYPPPLPLPPLLLLVFLLASLPPSPQHFQLDIPFNTRRPATLR